MICLKQYREMIKATDETIGEIVFDEINKLGNEGDLNHIDVSGVTNMNYLFWYSPFNGDISRWNVGNVQNMSGMFSYSHFNGDISNWNVGNVTHIESIFWKSLFNGDLSLWNVSNVEYMSCMFDHSPLEGREPWWYVLSPLFGSTSLMWDSLDFRWIDIERKIIYRERLSRILLRTYNTKWDGKLPPVFGFTYK